MSGFGNDSFDVNGAGGWARGDRQGGFGGGGVDFSSQDVEAKSAHFDKIPIPVTVADLAQMQPGQERIQLGPKSFSTVYVLGKVKSVTFSDGHQQMDYEVGDLDDDSATISVIHYKGMVEAEKATSSAFVEDTFVSIVGKIRSFEDKMSIVAFDVKEVEDPRQIQAFKLQARIARLYYEKDVASMSHMSDVTQFVGTMLQGPRGGASSAQSEGSKQAGGFGASEISRPKATVDHDNGNCRGLTGQKAEIFKCLMRNVADVNVGMSVNEIRASIPKNILNPKTFAADLDDLSSEGLIYTTLDDDHYVVNS